MDPRPLVDRPWREVQEYDVIMEELNIAEARARKESANPRPQRPPASR